MGIEPILKESQSRVLTVTLRPHLKILAEDIGFEPMRRFLSDSLANCSRNRLGNLPNLVQPVGIEPTSMVLQTTAMTTSAKVAWRKAEESNPIPVKRTWFSRPVAGPAPLHYFPYKNTLVLIYFYMVGAQRIEL